MIQEAITFMIIGAAITLAGYKIINTFIGKKRKKSIPKSKKESYLMVHNCSECSAECMLRDSIPPKIKNQVQGCNPVKIKSDIL